MATDDTTTGINLNQLRGRLLHREPGEPYSLEVCERPDGLRALHFGSQPTQSLLDPGKPWRLYLPYQQAMMSARLFIATPQQAWLLGLGGGALLHHLHHYLPEVAMLGVDNDPRVARLGQSWFGQQALNDRLGLVIDDASAFLDEQRNQGHHTDLLLIDLFDDQCMPPLMYDKDFYRQCREILSPAGVLSANMLFADEREFLQVVGDLREVFERRVLCLTVPEHGNVIVLAFASMPALTERRALFEQAKVLNAETGLPYRPFVDRLFHINPDQDGRLLI